MRHQIGAFAMAGLWYGVIAILLAGFIRNPTMDVGASSLLAPIAAAVLGGTAVSGGIGSMVTVTMAAVFLIQLDRASWGCPLPGNLSCRVSPLSRACCFQN